MAHTVMATFQVRGGATSALSALLDRHFAAIVRLGFGEDVKPVRLLMEGTGGSVLIEIFDWREGAIGEAANHSEIAAIWREIDALCEERNGEPAADFPRVQRLPTGTGFPR